MRKSSNHLRQRTIRKSNSESRGAWQQNQASERVGPKCRRANATLRPRTWSTSTRAHMDAVSQYNGVCFGVQKRGVHAGQGGRRSIYRFPGVWRYHGQLASVGCELQPVPTPNAAASPGERLIVWVDDEPEKWKGFVNFAGGVGVRVVTFTSTAHATQWMTVNAGKLG